MYDAIIELLRSGAAEAALNAAQEAVRAHPEDPQAHRLLSAALRLSRRPAEALESIERAIALEPEDSGLHLERGLVLLGTGDAAAAGEAMSTSVGLDPNKVAAYVVQAQLALSRGDIDEARSLASTASRASPEHPHVAALLGTIALRTGDAEKALKILGPASAHHPDDPVLRHALGFAYMAHGNLAFAEQAFRGLLESQPDSLAVRSVLADLVSRQGRAAEAVELVQPVLDTSLASPSLRRVVARHQAAAGQHAEAVDSLLALLRQTPGDTRALELLGRLWTRTGTRADAAAALDELLQLHPTEDELWKARVALERLDSPAGAEVVARWRQAAPESPRSMEAQMHLHDLRGEAAEAEALARGIVAITPGHVRAEMRIIQALLARDPAAAIEHVRGMHERAPEDARRDMRQLTGSVMDAAGRHADALATWAGLHSEVAAQRQPRPEQGEASQWWPELAAVADDAPRHVLLWGLPGSHVDRVGGLLRTVGAPLLADRFSERPPPDLFLYPDVIAELNGGRANAAALVESWRRLLPQRGQREASAVIDWLPWWDNALLHALRPNAPEVRLLVVLRDPRDMLLDWLAFGAPAPFALETPEAGAAWLASALEHIVALEADTLLPGAVLRIDGSTYDEGALATALSEALGAQVPHPPAGSLGGRRLPQGRWREYAAPLADAFALLQPVAVRLGYPAA